MKLSKTHYDRITKMLKEGDARFIKSYCEGSGIDTTKYSSPVYIFEDGKISLTYRNNTTYQY